jgi:hypothetical protein
MVDILGQLEAVEAAHNELLGDVSRPGLEHNQLAVAALLSDVRNVVRNSVGLVEAYSSGVTHEQRVLRSIGGPVPSDEMDSARARIAELERQLSAKPEEEGLK